MRLKLNRVLRWLLDPKHDRIIEEHLRRNREALEMKRQKLREESAVLPF